MSTTIPLDHPALNTPTTDNPSADAYASKPPYTPHYYSSGPDSAWQLVPWLNAALAESDHGQRQREYADELLRLDWPRAADRAVSCRHAWVPVRGCENRTPGGGMMHEADLVLTHCDSAFCPDDMNERERLDLFLYRDAGDLKAASREIIEQCVSDKRNPMVARIRLSMPLRTDRLYASIRTSHEDAHAAFRKWHDRIRSEHNMNTSQYGMVIADLIDEARAELWVLYIGPAVPFEHLRDHWKAVAGEGARFWHMRRPLSPVDSTYHQEEFEGMIEAELQHILTMPGWIRKAKGAVLARLHHAFRRFQLVRQVGYFYGYQQPQFTVSELDAQMAGEDPDAFPISDEQFLALCSVPTEELDRPLCSHCQAPLLPLRHYGSGHVSEFQRQFLDVRLLHRRRRPEHKHNTVSMCGEEWRKYRSRRAGMAAESPSPPS